MLYAFGSNQHAEPPHMSRLVRHNDHFEAAIVMKISMRGANDHMIVVMLQTHELVREQPGMVIIDQG